MCAVHEKGGGGVECLPTLRDGADQQIPAEGEIQDRDRDDVLSRSSHSGERSELDVRSVSHHQPPLTTITYLLLQFISFLQRITHYSKQLHMYHRLIII